jgi:predicted nucleic acid-binding protein
MLIEPVLVDAGALIALCETNDPLHAACVEQAKLLPVGKAYTCWPVITEAIYRLRLYPIERKRLLEAVRDGIYSLLPLDSNDVDGLEAIMAKYGDQQVDLADACLVQTAKGLMPCLRPIDGTSKSIERQMASISDCCLLRDQPERLAEQDCLD